ncbi:hypothetical protein CFP56_016855 [Quercus suber]|uniref:RNase H type-1 domain-containing protein n=1 Tax=Quercus suber TaxID=58331 RepID=A0AAW0IJJ1_QUESU
MPYACNDLKDSSCSALEATLATCVKANFDGAIFSQDGLAGIGIIIWNEQGLVMAALSQQIPLPTSVEMVEVLVVRWALFLLRNSVLTG